MKKVIKMEGKDEKGNEIGREKPKNGKQRRIRRVKIERVGKDEEGRAKKKWGEQYCKLKIKMKNGEQ